MCGAIAWDPYNLLSHAKQGPAITRALRQFDIDEEIGYLHELTVHTERLEAITFLSHA